jgi:serine/threonine protein kinase
VIAGLEILNLHAQGGMAEVYRARGKGADGRTWQYAVKRILPELTSNADLRSMFIEEARVASMLVHPNIVRVYDLAKSEVDELYIVMEFLEGRDLAEIIDRSIDQGRAIPIWLVIHAAREVLRALTYATTSARDREGNALALIHRDISPHNIFTTFDGQVKLTDFGVAKVAQSSVMTQVGVTKGKFGYMSPEQLMSEKLDFRSDLYNVGILLYETLTGRRLFFGENASQFLQAMMKNEVPPLDPGLRVPRELEHLMRLALAKDRRQRPPNASVFEAELRTIAERYNLVATHEHVAAELRALYGSEIDACAVGVAVSSRPKRLASVSAALPEVVQRIEAPPSTQVPQLQVPQDHVRSLSEPSLQVELEPLPARAPTKKRAVPKSNTRSVRPIDDEDPPTIPPEDPETIPPDVTDKMKLKRATVVVGGAGAKAIGLRVEGDDDWVERTSAEHDAPTVRGGIVGRSKRVVPLAPKKK